MEQSILYEEFSHHRQYKFQVTPHNGQFLLKIYNFQPEWKDFAPVQDMVQITDDKETAAKLGRAMLALLEN